MYYIVGLGNPGEKYELSRHNTGRIVVGEFLKKQKIKGLNEDKKLKALTTEGKIKKEKFTAVLPETFMNKSGLSLKPVASKLVKPMKKKDLAKTGKKKDSQAETLIVIHDDIDLPLGKFKISFGKGSGGHKGIESVIKNVKTKNFIRIRVGICPTTPSGKPKKPQGKKMLDFIIDDFKPKEFEVLKKVSQKIAPVLEAILVDGLARAMSIYN